MFIASKLKKENICGYILYMWQVEDLIRAFGLDIDRIDEKIVRPYPLQNENERKSLYEWYESLIEMMRLEGVSIEGHLQINKNIVQDVNEFHLLLLKSGKEAGYNAKFFHILPFINQLRRHGTSDISDIELIFNFQYGIMTLRMKKTPISEQTMQAQVEISKFMELLAKFYQAHQKGELDLEE